MKYSCAFCPVAFLRPEHRTRHQAMHTGPNHTCHYCDRAFTRQDSLKRHFKLDGRATPWNRDSLMNSSRWYVEGTVNSPSIAVEGQNQPMISNHSQRNQLMSIKHLVS
ncbi:hypothetical protein HDV02_000024 [Globomyces sp. JEL0801]|nr:hypothetical protein HDV02_000024 [Globomyces sp. JEL0801]